MENEVVERFLRYVQIHTTSDPDQDQEGFPSTQRQFKLAKLLVEELQDLGISNAHVDEKCVVYASIPANIDEKAAAKVPTICFSAHLDTSPAEPGDNVQPKIHLFTGEDLVISEDKNIIISAESIPDAQQYLNTKFISADGRTLLGADDKAGIAEIMAAVVELQNHPEIQHGEIRIVFSPDEEIGTGSEAVDIENLGAEFGYTVDGGELGEFEIECFNAANGTIEIKGYNVHPGAAYGQMRNSLRALPQILQLFPHSQAPETTKDYEGYYHPYKLSGDVNYSKIEFILRSFDETELESYITQIQEGVANVQREFPNLEISVEMKKGYRNMKSILDKYPHVIQIAKRAIKEAEIEIKEKPIRGGTDGARYSFRGMPTPNLFTGGLFYHSKKEICSVMAMKKAVQVILNIIRITYEQFS